MTLNEQLGEIIGKHLDAYMKDVEEKGLDTDHAKYLLICAASGIFFEEFGSRAFDAMVDDIKKANGKTSSKKLQ